MNSKGIVVPFVVASAATLVSLIACSGESAPGSLIDDAGVVDSSDDQSSVDAATADAPKDAPLDSLPADCPPCAAHYACSVMASSPGTIMPDAVRLPDGSCMVSTMTLKCGGKGTGGNGTAITWSVENGDLWILIPNASLDCKAQ